MKKQWSAEELNKRNQIQKNRVRIANMVKRNRPDLIKCYICGSTDAKILHNDDLDNPYMINFICNDCRKNKENIKNKIKDHSYKIKSELKSQKK